MLMLCCSHERTQLLLLTNKLNDVVKTMDRTWSHDIHEYAVCLKAEVLAALNLDVLARKRMHEGEVGKSTIKKTWDSVQDIGECRRFHKNRLEASVRRVCRWVLLDTTAGVRAIADIHSEEAIVDDSLAIRDERHLHRFMGKERHQESEEIIDVMAADIGFERRGVAAAMGIDTKADGVDEVAMVLLAVAVVGDTPQINRVRLAIEESIQRAAVVARKMPIASPVVARTTRHQSYAHLGTLLGRDVRTHDAIDRLAERTIAPQDEYLIVAILDQFTRQFDSMVSILSHTVCEGQMAALKQLPEIESLRAECPFAGLGVDDDA